MSLVLVEDKKTVQIMKDYAGVIDGENYRCVRTEESEDLLNLGTICGRIGNACFDQEVVDFFFNHSIPCLAVLDDKNRINALFAHCSGPDGGVIEYLIEKKGGSLKFEEGSAFEYEEDPYVSSNNGLCGLETIMQKRIIIFEIDGSNLNMCPYIHHNCGGCYHPATVPAIRVSCSDENCPLPKVLPEGFSSSRTDKDF